MNVYFVTMSKTTNTEMHDEKCFCINIMKKDIHKPFKYFWIKKFKILNLKRYITLNEESKISLFFLVLICFLNFFNILSHIWLIFPENVWCAGPHSMCWWPKNDETIPTFSLGADQQWTDGIWEMVLFVLPRGRAIQEVLRPAVSQYCSNIRSFNFLKIIA